MTCIIHSKHKTFSSACITYKRKQTHDKDLVYITNSWDLYLLFNSTTDLFNYHIHVHVYTLLNCFKRVFRYRKVISK